MFENGPRHQMHGWEIGGLRETVAISSVCDILRQGYFSPLSP